MATPDPPLELSLSVRRIFDAIDTSRAGLKAVQARLEADEARLVAEQARLTAKRPRLAAEQEQLARGDAAITSAFGGAKAAYTRCGERFVDVLPLAAARGYAAEASQALWLCGETWRAGDLGATNDMIVSSLRLQCGAAQAREARREDFTFVRPDGIGLRALNGTTQLIRATILNNLPRVLQLIQLGAPLDLVDQLHGYSALHWASFLGHEHVVAALLEGKYKGVDVEQACGGMTSLDWASLFGRVGVVRVLLTRDAKQVRPGETYSAMYGAARCNHIEVVKLLLAAPGASDALKTKFNGRTPLKLAIDEGHAEIAALLRAAGAPEG